MSVSTLDVVPDSIKRNVAPSVVLTKAHYVGEKSDFPGPILGEEPDFDKAWLEAHYNAKGDGAFLQQYHLVHINGVNDKTFQWGIGALVIKASLDTDIQDIRGQIGIQIPILGYHTIRFQRLSQAWSVGQIGWGSVCQRTTHLHHPRDGTRARTVCPPRH
ncbi:hypothetical protein JAAARDRAFT_39867 [Jaapia argillacea MUCL 33604]|uniref:Uncharacterized protein n=1 Tax=Jaapia argillacea MUCL 33604 TaxID=933084 RepID=A0A067PGI9_9AGAM|nr:hypothetical protein JAAARDRAFT_39867 [Jaapia argillacea MUCL 33604]